MDNIRKALDVSRLELLDVGLRSNTLLHFSSGAKTLSIIDERAVQVFNLLVELKKPMSFLPAPNVYPKDFKLHLGGK